MIFINEKQILPRAFLTIQLYQTKPTISHIQTKRIWRYSTSFHTGILNTDMKCVLTLGGWKGWTCWLHKYLLLFRGCPRWQYLWPSGLGREVLMCSQWRKLSFWPIELPLPFGRDVYYISIQILEGLSRISDPQDVICRMLLSMLKKSNFLVFCLNWFATAWKTMCCCIFETENLRLFVLKLIQ